MAVLKTMAKYDMRVHSGEDITLLCVQPPVLCARVKWTACTSCKIIFVTGAGVGKIFTSTNHS